MPADKAVNEKGSCNVCYLLGFGGWGDIVKGTTSTPPKPGTSAPTSASATPATTSRKNDTSPSQVKPSPSLQPKKSIDKPPLASSSNSFSEDKPPTIDRPESKTSPSPSLQPSPAIKPGGPPKPKPADKNKPVSRRRLAAEEADQEAGQLSSAVGVMVGEKKVQGEKSNLEILQGSLGKLAEAEKYGASTLTKLAMQREQMLRIDDDLNTINQCMARCERMIKGMESIGGTITNMFTKPTVERDHHFKMPSHGSSSSSSSSSSDRSRDESTPMNITMPKDIKGSEECDELRFPQQLKDKGIELSNSRATTLFKEAVLHKAAEGTTKYQDRLVRVYQSRIEYYVPGKLKEPRGTIPITARSKIGPGISTKPYAFSFTPDEGKRKYEFFAENDTQKKEWIELLSKLVHEKNSPPPQEERIIYHYYTQNALAGIGKDWTSDCVLFTSKRFIQIEKDKVVAEVNLCDLICVEMPPSRQFHLLSEKLIAKKVDNTEVSFKLPKEGAHFFHKLFGIMLGELTQRRNTRTTEELFVKSGGVPVEKTEADLEDEALDGIERIVDTLDNQAKDMNQEFDLQAKILDHLKDKVETTQERIEVNDGKVKAIVKKG